MEGRKYTQYQIIVSYLNGDKETILHKDYDSNSYKAMLELYRETKKQFASECCVIEFAGVTENSEINILFEKRIITDDLKIKEKADKIHNDSSLKLIKDLVDSINNITDKKEKLNENLNILNKKQDVILHMIEGNKDESVEDILKTYNELKNLRKERRDSKNEKVIIDRCFQKLTNNNIAFNNVKSLCNEFINKEEYRSEIESKKDYTLTPQKVEELKIMKEVKYRNFKERINLIKQLNNKYDKVYYDDSKMLVTCYNKSH